MRDTEQSTDEQPVGRAANSTRANGRTAITRDGLLVAWPVRRSIETPNRPGRLVRVELASAVCEQRALVADGDRAADCAADRLLPNRYARRRIQRVDLSSRGAGVDGAVAGFDGDADESLPRLRLHVKLGAAPSRSEYTLSLSEPK
jgi:hypothetical protein